MGRLTLIGRLAVRDLRYRRGEAVLLLLVISAATITLTLGLALSGVTSQPYQQTRAATGGPDIVAGFVRLEQGPSLQAGLAAMKALARQPGVVGRSGPFPVSWPTAMALCIALFARIAGPLGRAGAHRVVAFGLVLDAIGLYLFSRLGAGVTFAGLMPGFVLFGAKSGLMNVPLTNAVLGAMPQERSGIASALLNNSREVAGLLGITVIGAVLRSRQGVALQHGVRAAPAFIDGYHAGLAVTIALVAVGAVVGYAALRRAPRATAGAEPARPVDTESPAGQVRADGQRSAAALAPLSSAPQR